MLQRISSKWFSDSLLSCIITPSTSPWYTGGRESSTRCNVRKHMQIEKAPANQENIFIWQQMGKCSQHNQIHFICSTFVFWLCCEHLQRLRCKIEEVVFLICRRFFYLQCVELSRPPYWYHIMFHKIPVKQPQIPFLVCFINNGICIFFVLVQFVAVTTELKYFECEIKSV